MLHLMNKVRVVLVFMCLREKLDVSASKNILGLGCRWRLEGIIQEYSEFLD